MKKNNFIFIIGLLFVMGCSKADKQHIREDFNHRYPHAKILSIGSGEGDSDNAYYHIKYRVKGSNTSIEAIFLYQYKNSKWEFVIDTTSNL